MVPDIDTADRALRKLRLHFPKHSEGFLFLLLKEYDYDPTECLIRMKDKKVPLWLTELPKNFTMEDARNLLAVRREDLRDEARHVLGRHRHYVYADENHPPSKTKVFSLSSEDEEIGENEAIKENEVENEEEDGENEVEGDEVEEDEGDEETSGSANDFIDDEAEEDDGTAETSSWSDGSRHAKRTDYKADDSEIETENKAVQLVPESDTSSDESSVNFNGDSSSSDGIRRQMRRAIRRRIRSSSSSQSSVSPNTPRKLPVFLPSNSPSPMPTSSESCPPEAISKSTVHTNQRWSLFSSNSNQSEGSSDTLKNTAPNKQMDNGQKEESKEKSRQFVTKHAMAQHENIKLRGFVSNLVNEEFKGFRTITPEMLESLRTAKHTNEIQMITPNYPAEVPKITEVTSRGSSPSSDEFRSASGDFCYYNALEYFLEKEQKYGEDIWPKGIELETLSSADGFRVSLQDRRWLRPGGGVPHSHFRREFPLSLGSAVMNELYGYQRTAVAWMYELLKHSAGGILGDEMGLGKTVETVSFFRGLFSSELAGSILVLCPLTLMQQWQNHLKKWVGTRCDTVIYHGTKQEREKALRTIDTDHPFVVLTTPETFRNCEELRSCPPRNFRTKIQRAAETIGSKWNQPALHQLPWDVLVVDEAHKLKNPSNKLNKAVRECHTTCRLLLTGTPVMNKLEELWALMDIAMPGLLGRQATFKEEFAVPLTRGLAKDASSHQRKRTEACAVELYRIVRPYFLRRTKTDPPVIASQGESKETTGDQEDSGASRCRVLPDKTDLIVWLELSEIQRKVYTTLLLSREASNVLKNDTCDKLGRDSLWLIGRLQKVCRHPVLLLPSTLQSWKSAQVIGLPPSGSPENAGVEEESAFVKYVHSLIEQDEPEDLIESSTKLLFLSRTLPEIRKRKHRLLIFSQSLDMLSMVERCVLKPLKLTYRRVDGSVAAEVRSDIFAECEQNTDIFALLLSTKIGGVGLNLTWADRAIIMEPDWTPANDNQAVARIHRTGQQKEVLILRLFVAGAIEDHAFRLQTLKQGITKAALQNSNQMAYFKSEELRQIFTLKDKGCSTTKNILKEAHREFDKSESILEEKLIAEIGQEAFENISDVYFGLSDSDDMYSRLLNAGKLENETSNDFTELLK